MSQSSEEHEKQGFRPRVLVFWFVVVYLASFGPVIGLLNAYNTTQTGRLVAGVVYLPVTIALQCIPGGREALMSYTDFWNSVF